MNSEDKLSYIKKRNSLLQRLDLKCTDRVIFVKENSSAADGNFVMTNIMQQNFVLDDNVCLLILHNTIGHYHNVGRKLNYNLLRKIEEGCACTVEPLKTIVENIPAAQEETSSQDNCFNYLASDSEGIVKKLFLEVKSKVELLLNRKGNVYMYADDLSHLYDLGVKVKDIVTFVNCCVGLTDDVRVYLVLGYHCPSDADPKETLVATYLEHLADVTVEIGPLRTGRSNDVTGVLAVKRLRKDGRKETIFHYKSTDKEIRVFNPGEALIYYR